MQKRWDTIYLTVFYVLAILIMVLKFAYVTENLKMIPLNQKSDERFVLFRRNYYTSAAGLTLKAILGAF